MSSDEAHYRNCTFYELRPGSNATVATKNICDVYGSVISGRKCQEWFAKFRSGDFDQKDLPQPGRPSELDNDVLTLLVESDPELAKHYPKDGRQSSKMMAIT